MTPDSEHLLEYYKITTDAQWLVKEGTTFRLAGHGHHDLYQQLRDLKHAGLVLFTSGTTGNQKAILHDFEPFFERYLTPRPSLRTLSFLRFDHIGGINTFFHTLSNRGELVQPESTEPQVILNYIRDFKVEVLPTTPTFLRFMLLSGFVPDKVSDSLKIITYGTERMQEMTLIQYARLLPEIDFRQTYGMSELGILRVRSESRDSLFMKVGGEGIQIKIDELGQLLIKSSSRMMGYLNSPSPFDSNGWYPTGDLVEQKNDLIKIVGRLNDVINVGGLKFFPSEVERIAIDFPNVQLVKVTAAENPITGQHVELKVQTENEKFDLEKYRNYLTSNLQKHMVPRRISTGPIDISHRYKQL